MLQKQGLKLKLDTKVVNASKKDNKVYVNVEPAKGGNNETVRKKLIRVAKGGGSRGVSKAQGVCIKGVSSNISYFFFFFVLIGRANVLTSFTVKFHIPSSSLK